MASSDLEHDSDNEPVEYPFSDADIELETQSNVFIKTEATIDSEYEEDPAEFLHKMTENELPRKLRRAAVRSLPVNDERRRFKDKQDRMSNNAAFKSLVRALRDEAIRVTDTGKTLGQWAADRSLNDLQVPPEEDDDLKCLFRDIDDVIHQALGQYEVYAEDLYWANFFVRYDKKNIRYEDIPVFFNMMRKVFAVIRTDGVERCYQKMSVNRPFAQFPRLPIFKAYFETKKSYEDRKSAIQSNVPRHKVPKPVYKTYTMKEILDLPQCNCVYTSDEYLPYSGPWKDDIPLYNFNTYRGWKAEWTDSYRTPDGKLSEGVCIIKDFILKVMANGDKAKAMFLEHLLAHMLQYPNVKLGQAIIFLSRPGAGKNTFFEMFENNIIGPLHSYTLEGMRRLFDKFTGETAHKSMVVISELYSDDKRNDVFSKFKPMITDRKATIERKFREAEKTFNYATYFICCNDLDSVFIEEFCRRFIIYEMNNDYANDCDYFTELRKYFEDQQVCNQFYSYLMSLKVLNMFDKKNIPKTEATERIKQRSAGYATQFIKSVISGKINVVDLITKLNKNTDEYEIIWRQKHTRAYISKRTLFLLFADYWCPSRRINTTMTLDGFKDKCRGLVSTKQVAFKTDEGRKFRRLILVAEYNENEE